MARIFTIIALVVAAVVTQAEAAKNCQCLFSNGSHCCVYYDGNFHNLNCQQVCNGAIRGKDDKPCNAGGKYTTVGEWNAQFRQSCKGSDQGK